MAWKLVARGCVGATLISISILVGEKKEHLHVEAEEPVVLVEPIVVQTSAVFISATLSPRE